MAPAPDGFERHRARGDALLVRGDVAGAEASYRRALVLRPDAAEVHANLGWALLALGRAAEAEASCLEALRRRPGLAAAHVNLGNALRAQGRLADAEASYRQALAHGPDLPEAHANLGAVLWARGKLAESIERSRRALVLRPGYIEAHANLAAAFHALGRAADAEASYRQALAFRPGDPASLNGLGVALAAQGRLAEGLASYDEALARAPDYAEALTNRGNALLALGDVAAAVESHRRAVAVRPDLAEAWSNLANAWLARGDLHAGLECARRAAALRPDFAEAHLTLANVLAHRGDLTAALERCRRAVALEPDRVEVHANLVFMLDLDPVETGASCFAERRRWNRHHARPRAGGIAPHPNAPDPERRLRVGYVSADFRRHSAAAVVAPVILGHDRERFDVICYSGVLQPDGVTDRFRAASSRWRSTAGVPDDAVAATVREDRIDILVDLSGFSAGSRLGVFARKPAPVQVTAWGHAVGTGLDAMDYFLADPVTVPLAMRRHFSETVVDLPGLVCYEPPADAPDVGPPPALERGHVTFGSLNRLSKLSPETLALWAEILAALPDARLLVKFTGLDEPHARERLSARFGALGVGAERMEVRGGTEQREHLAAYGEVDVALDPFPHGGGVTGLEGLWMGVPMVTLGGERVPGRMGVSFMTAVGLGEFVAGTREEYARVALRWARDVERLGQVRAGLRGWMRGSALCDGARYCRAVEAAYREMWRRWCAGRGARGSR